MAFGKVPKIEIGYEAGTLFISFLCEITVSELIPSITGKFLGSFSDRTGLQVRKLQS
jgi:hypothetical protein